MTINQTTPATAEAAWDAKFRDGTLNSTFFAPGANTAQPAAALSLVKAGNGWATLTLDNDYTGTTTVTGGILQVEGPGTAGLIDRFAAWDARTVDLPGRYYADALNWLFRDNRLAGGDFPVFGRPTPLSRVTAPIFALAGEKDAVAPPPQVFGALDLVGTPAPARAKSLADCGHLSLFMGARTLAREWVEIAAWMRR